MVTSSHPLVYVCEERMSVYVCVWCFSCPSLPASAVRIVARGPDCKWSRGCLGEWAHKRDRTGICNMYHTHTYIYATHTEYTPPRARYTHPRRYIRLVLSVQWAPWHIGKGTAVRQPEAANGSEWEREWGWETDRVGERKGPASKRRWGNTKKKQSWVMQIVLPCFQWIQVFAGVIQPCIYH